MTRQEELRKMVAEATPGPWEVVKGSVPLGDTGDYDPFCDVRANGKQVFDAWRDDDQTEKDARLLAQAPTLATDLADALDRLARLAVALKPFADAWQITMASTDRMSGLSMGQLGALAAYQVTGAHFHRAHAALAAFRGDTEGGQG